MSEHQPTDAQSSRKRVTGAPRIFISYRREDSSAVTGRIYDRLAAAFGSQHVFKDVDNIPPGANFKTMLEQEVRSCDVLLAVIGDKWLNIQNANGQRRLDDPDDFVRIEVAAALNRQDITLIPLLVNNARMPGVDDLPPDLQELAYRNAAPVRNDPDFNRDVKWLIEEIRNDFEIVPAAPPKRANALSRLAIPLVLAALLVVGAFVLTPMLRAPEPTPQPTAQAEDTPVVQAPTDAPAGIPTVAPVEPGDYMVLVAELEQMGDEARDVSRFIVRDLTRKLEEEVPFSQVRVRQYPGIIRSDDEARQIAENTGASVIVWGNYTPDLIELEVQIGSTAAFPNNPFDRSLLERTLNVTVNMTNERQESVVNAVVGVLTGLHLADGNAYEIARSLAIVDQIDAPGLVIDGSGISAHMHQFLGTLLDDTETAIDEVGAAITLDPGNPILYVSRQLAHLRVGSFTAASQDARSAARVSPEAWVMPEYADGLIAHVEQDYDGAIQAYTDIIEERPEDWFPYNMRGWYHYLKRDYEAAVADYEQAIALKPNSNFPYIVAALIAMRQGRMSDARAHFDTIVRDFPDPNFGNRVVKAIFGDRENDLIGPLFSATGNLILEQYDQLLGDIQHAIQVDDQMPDLYALEGYAYCNLGDYEQAEASYTKAIELEPDNPFGYVLRADPRLKQFNLLGANDDANRARQLIEATGTGKELLAYINAGLLGQVSCQNFLEWEPPA